MRKLVILSLLCWQQMLMASEITLIKSDQSTNSDTEITSESVPLDVLSSRSRKLMAVVLSKGDEFLTHLEKNTTADRQWVLSSIEIGPGGMIKAGLPVVKIGGTAGFKLVFERQE